MATVNAAKDREKSGDAEHFKVALKYIITRELSSKRNCSLECDYGPCILLYEACEVSGFPASNIPWNSFMYIDSKNCTIEAKSGYDSQMISI